VPTAAAVAASLVNAIAVVVGALESLRKASPFYHYVAGDPLRHGFAPGHTAVLLLVGVALAVPASFAFERRDLT
jgi:ABC-2 type transport system permease protein